MSTEHQKYSTANQADAIRQYAERRGMAIVRTYEDAGKSGLDIKGRSGLRQLIEDVQGGNPGFEAILVYDVSRWGRFQDADESAYYEYICRRNGVSVHYCAEQFENDDGPIATIVKGVKRAMAGEYSRELSAKTFAGQRRMIKLGYRAGGRAGIGLRRMQVDEDGNRKGMLGAYERKNRFTDHVILVPGPREERDLVNRIYRLFVNHGKSETEIAKLLNSEGLMNDHGTAWSWPTIHQVLTNEKYIGNNIYYRSTCKLKQRRVSNPPNKWIRKNGAFEPIVDHRLFGQAQRILRKRAHRVTQDEVLDHLKSLLEKHGYLSSRMIDDSDDAVTSAICCLRFGSLRAAYKLVGFEPAANYSYIDIRRRLGTYHPLIVREVISRIQDLGATVAGDPVKNILSVNDEFTVSIVVARHDTTPWAGSSRWVVRFDARPCPDITVAVRMDCDNRRIFDYYLLPRVDFAQRSIRLAEENGAGLDTYRFESLDFLFCLAERVKLKEVA